MKEQLPSAVHAYVQAINNHDADAFLALFADGAIVHDVGREFQGLTEIADWSQREIFDVRVSLAVLGVVNRDSETIITAKCDGTFNRTGLPDPLILEHRVVVESGKIVALTCRLADGQACP